MSKITLELKTRPYIDNLRGRALRGVVQAGIFYKNELKSKIKKWSTIRLGGNKVLWKYALASKPGNPPHRATGNYYNSIQMTGRQFVHKSRVTVFTPVSYAPALELGGKPKRRPRKKFTQLKVVNPLHPQFIQPRPHWVPTFNSNIEKMVNIIRRELRNA